MKEKEYLVSIPIAGVVHVTVTASSLDEAIVLGWERAQEYENDNDEFEVQWEFYRAIVRSGVLQAPDNVIVAREGS